MTFNTLKTRTGLIYALALLLTCAGLVSIAHAKTATIRFAYQDRIGSAIPIIAVSQGALAQAGLDIKPLRFSSGPASAEALYTGAADIAGMGDTTAIIMAARSSKFVIIASHSTGEHRHRIMVKKDSPLQSIQDLRGKRVGVKKGTSTYGGLLAALQKAGMSESDLVITDLSPSTMVQALQAGSLDAFVASEPTPSAAEQKGARELATLGGLGNQYPILLLVNRDFLQKHRDAVENFLQALKKAERFIADHPAEAEKIMAAETGLNPATNHKAMQMHSYRLTLDREIIASLQQTAQFLKDQRIIKQVPDFSTAVADGLLK